MESSLPSDNDRLETSTTGASFSRDMGKARDTSPGSQKPSGSSHQIQNARTSPQQQQPVKFPVLICPTTGGNFELGLTGQEKVAFLKATIGQRLRIPKERINLLFRDRILGEGSSLAENGIGPNSRITLLPSIHTGLMSQKTEHSMMQALENLTDSQVNDFICGKSPLTLAMRMGDHMMFVQLQLSTSPPGARRAVPFAPLHHCPNARSLPSQALRTTKHHSSSTSSTPPSSPEASPSPSYSPAPYSSSPTPSPSPPHTCSSSSSSLSSAGSSMPRFTFPPPPSLSNPSHSATATRLGRQVQGQGHRTPSSSAPSSSSRHPDPVTLLDSTALANAKRSLSLKLKEFSQKASSSHMQENAGETPASAGAASGAIIESMHHLGRGVYSGTFSGTLNPQLQDYDGKPKRSISTIIHILNDLLGASPQYSPLTGAARPTCKRHRPASPPDQDAPHSPKLRKTEESERLSHENELMRTKIEQLQMMLEQRRLKRRRHRTDTPPPCTQAQTSKDTEKDLYGSIQSREMAANLEELCSELEADLEQGTVVS